MPVMMTMIVVSLPPVKQKITKLMPNGNNKVYCECDEHSNSDGNCNTNDNDSDNDGIEDNGNYNSISSSELQKRF